MGLYDNVLAQARQAEAMAAIDVPAEQATQYGAALGMARAKQGANQMFGIEEPAVIAAKAAESQQQLLLQIRDKYQSATTRDDFTKAMNELMANGFPAEAKLMQEHIKNMPAPKGKTDKIANYEYGKSLPEDKQQEYFDLINPGQVPASYAEYKRTDTTPTGEEFLTYLAANGKDATLTPQYRNYLNTTDTPTKAGFAIFLDRNESMQKFGSAKEARITTLMNDPTFLIKTQEEKDIILNSIESEYKQIETFTQAGVVYNADNKEAMLPGSKETIPTVTVGGKVLDARTMTVLNSDGVKREMVKRDDKQWYYVDTATKVFANDVTVADPETKATEIYTEFGMPKNEGEKVALASKLIKNGLAGTKIFSDLMASVDKDSANAIQRENLVVKSIERLGDSYTDSGVGTMNTILEPVERLINQYMTKSEDVNGTVSYEGSIPGWATIKRGQRLQPGKIGYEARFFAENASTLINTVLKQRSGQAVTDPEWKRLQDEYSTGWQTSAGFSSWVERIRDFTNKTQQNVVGGYQPIVVNRYFANQGQYVTLSNPDDPSQRNQIPIGGFYKDGEGNIRQRTQ